jgi:hypothetical protein
MGKQPKEESPIPFTPEELLAVSVALHLLGPIPLAAMCNWDQNAAKGALESARDKIERAKRNFEWDRLPPWTQEEK